MESKRVWSNFQQAIFRDVAEGTGHTVVLARAGCGKTSSIMQALTVVPRGLSTLVCAFNKSIEKELAARVNAAGLPVQVKTLHAFGYQAVGRAFNRPQLNEYKVRDILDKLVPGDERREMRDELRKCVSLCKGNLIEHDDVDGVDGICIDYSIDAGEDPKDRLAFCKIVLDVMDICARDTKTIDFDDMVWLAVVLDLNVFQFDRVFVDETQDLNAAQIELMLKACKKGGRICVVGDDRQCHPPGVMIRQKAGVDVPIESLKTGDKIMSWNRKVQRMLGGREIEIASRPYAGNLVDVYAAGRSVPMTPDHRVLCRWTDRNVNTCVTYLMWREGFGFRVGWCKLFAKAGHFGSLHLAHRARIEFADKVWVLKTHESRTGASVYESIIAAKYGIPTATFEPVDNAEHQTAGSIKKIFDAVADENNERGTRVLRDHGLMVDLPLYPWPGKFIESPQGRRTYFEVYAVNLLPDLMSVPLPEDVNTWTKIDATSQRHYEGEVYSMNVADDHTYSANGIVVLNCIYSFRGADTNTIGKLTARLDAKVLPLSITYRCARKIVALAAQTVPDFEAAPNAIDGEIIDATYEQIVTGARPGDFILSRTNAPLVKQCLALLAHGTAAAIQGRDVSAQLLKVVRKSKANTIPDLAGWLRGWRERECTRLLRKDPDADTTRITDIAECIDAICEGETTVASVVAKIQALFSDTDETRRVTLSSTHKAKGLERDRAWVLAGTYRPSAGPEEANLWYVAITRAKTTLFLVRSEEQQTKRAERKALAQSAEQ